MKLILLGAPGAGKGTQAEVDVYKRQQLYNAGVPKIEIERTFDSQSGKPRVRVTIHCAKPGMVIGKGGAEKEKLQAQLTKMINKDAVSYTHLEEKGALAKAIAEIQGIFQQGGNPCAVVVDGRPVEFSFLPLTQYGLQAEHRRCV